MRFNPPAAATEQYKVLKDCQLGKYKFKKGALFGYLIHELHKNPHQWYHPEKYLPDRFNPEHQYFNKPNGDPRHPNAYMPFGFGERKCVGYLFALTIMPLLITKIISSFDFEFTEDHMNDEDWFPEAQFFLNNYPPVPVKATALVKIDGEEEKTTAGSEFYDF
jgi:cytochrome P450